MPSVACGAMSPMKTREPNSASRLLMTSSPLRLQAASVCERIEP
jgi:hypothetical protein